MGDTIVMLWELTPTMAIYHITTANPLGKPFAFVEKKHIEPVLLI